MRKSHWNSHVRSHALLVLLIKQLISVEHHLLFYYSTLHTYSQQHPVLNITTRMKRCRVAYERFTGERKTNPTQWTFWHSCIELSGAYKLWEFYQKCWISNPESLLICQPLVKQVLWEFCLYTTFLYWECKCESGLHHGNDKIIYLCIIIVIVYI